MGVVRREGSWRLEKEEEGHYEITHQKEAQAKVVTPEYTPGMMDDASLAPVPIQEVESYEEVKGTFEEYAKGKQTGVDPLMGGNSTTGSTNQGSLGFGSDGAGDGGLSLEGGDGDLLEDAENIPPGVFGLALLLTGVFAVSTSGLAPGEPVFLVGVGMAGVGLLIFAWAGILLNSQGWEEAVEFLTRTNDEERSSTKSDNAAESEQEKTPPTPEKLKRELIFGRADQECEWCGDFVDNPEVHHIKPRSEGGPNKPNNLIVLCPTCHRKADSGGISQTKLREKLRHISNERN